MTRVVGVESLAYSNATWLEDAGFDSSGARYVGVVDGGYEYGSIELYTGETFFVPHQRWTKERAQKWGVSL